MDIVYRPIGTVHSPLSPGEAPRQPRFAPDIEGEIEIHPSLQEGLRDIDGFSHIMIVFHIHRSEGYELVVRTPWDEEPHGVFATRSPRRPNPIGVSVVRLLGREGPRLRIGGHDMIDGTPVLDIKPFVGEVEGEVSRGWLGEKVDRDPLDRDQVFK